MSLRSFFTGIDDITWTIYSMDKPERDQMFRMMEEGMKVKQIQEAERKRLDELYRTPPRKMTPVEIKAYQKWLKEEERLKSLGIYDTYQSINVPNLKDNDYLWLLKNGGSIGNTGYKRFKEEFANLTPLPPVDYSKKPKNGITLTSIFASIVLALALLYILGIVYDPTSLFH